MATIAVASALSATQQGPAQVPIKLAQNVSAQAPEGLWQPEETENRDLHAFLRGRRLIGSRMELPAGYTGLVAQSAGAHGTDASPREWVATSMFSHFVQYGHDVAPSQADPLRRALDWCPLAAQVHSAVDVGDVEAELKAMSSGGSAT